MRKKFVTFLMAITMTMAMPMAMAGCASSNNTGTDAGSGSSSSDAADAGSASSSDASSNAAIGESTVSGSAALEDGVLNVGTNAEFPPFEYVGDDGEPDGFDMALIKAIGEKMGTEVEIENMEFDSLVAAIGSKIDVAIAGMTVLEERLDSVNFSDPYYEAVQYVIVPADSDITKAKDLEGKTIGVQLGTTGDFKAEEIKDASVSQYNKGLDAVNDLMNGRVDAVIIDKNPAKVFADRFGDDVKVYDGSDSKFGFKPEEYAIALPKEDDSLLEAVNQALAEIKSDGTFDELVSQYIEE